jgi:hypothetical protein
MVAEVATFASAPSDSAVASIENYLSQRFNIPLAAPWQVADYSGPIPSTWFRQLGVNGTTTSVTTWVDEATTGTPASTVTGSGAGLALTFNAINGFSAVSFSNDNMLQLAGVSGGDLFSPEESAFFVVQRSGGTSLSSMTTFGWISSTCSFKVHATWRNWLFFNMSVIPSGLEAQRTDAFHGAGQWRLISGRRSGSAAELRDSGLVAAQGTMSSSCATPLGAAPLTLGGDTNGNRIVGDIAELITFRSAVSDSMLATFEAYLADKYGLSLASRCVNPPNCASLNRVACSNTEANPADTCGPCLTGFTFTVAGGGGFANSQCASATPTITQQP